MTSKTWMVCQQARSLNRDLNACYPVVTTIHNGILQLYHEPEQDKREILFKKLSRLDKTVFRSLTEFLDAMLTKANDEGFESIPDWVYNVEDDPVDWQGVFDHPDYQKVIARYSSGLAAAKKKQHATSKFCPWDFWYQPKTNSQNCFETSAYFGDFDSSLKFIESFFAYYGLLDEFKKITFKKVENSPTYAQIGFENNEWTRNVVLSDVGAGTMIGTYKYCATIAHETAHNIHSSLISKPDENNYLPPYLVCETISLFFERLFASSDVLYDKIHQQVEWPFFQRYIRNEQKDILVRILSMIEFEISLYQLHKTKKLTPPNLSRAFVKQQSHYFGFETQLRTCHLWQRDLFYIAYTPLKSRSYVYGIVLGDGLLEHMQRDWMGLKTKQRNPHLIKTLKKICHHGSFATWSDYTHECLGKDRLGTEDIIWGIRRILES